MFFNIVKFLWFGNEGKLFLIFFYLSIFFRNYWAQLLVHRISIGVLGREIVGRQLMLLLKKVSGPSIEKFSIFSFKRPLSDRV